MQFGCTSAILVLMILDLSFLKFELFRAPRTQLREIILSYRKKEIIIMVRLPSSASRDHQHQSPTSPQKEDPLFYHRESQRASARGHLDPSVQGGALK